MAQLKKNTKTFSVQAVLSITTDYLFASVDDLYAILNFITGDSLFTHVLPRAARFSKPFILAQYPALEDITNESIQASKEAIGWERTYEKVVAIVTKSMGAELEIEAAPEGVWNQKDPIEELIEMRGGTDGIIVVNPKSEGATNG